MSTVLHAALANSLGQTAGFLITDFSLRVLRNFKSGVIFMSGKNKLKVFCLYKSKVFIVTVESTSLIEWQRTIFMAGRCSH